MSEWSRATVDSLWRALDSELNGAVELRRALHREPDGSGNESNTAETILTALGVQAAHEVCGARLVRIGSAGASVALRAELDALPIDEQTGVDWAATNGFMHACGHDVHMAAVTACARAIETVGAIVPLIVLLQPREESIPSGAADLVETDVFGREDVRAMIGVHVQPRLRGGEYSAVAGAVNASADEFDIHITAQGGHAGYPHVTGDPIVAAAHIITTLQSIVSRRIDPLHPSVITVGSLHAGHAPNVIPNSAVLSGTLRSFDPADRTFLQDEIVRTAQVVSAVFGCEAQVDLRLGEPPLINHPELTRLVSDWIGDSTSLDGVELRSCGADDFSYYGSLFPSTMVFYGVGDAAPSSPGLHHPQFLPSDDDVAGVARCHLAAYLAGCELILGPIKETS